MQMKLKSFSASLNYATWAELSQDFVLAQGLIDENIYAIKTTKSIIKQEFVQTIKDLITIRISIFLTFTTRIEDLI
jgi:hypothetical protein